jgi:hypothetical protein
MKALTLRQPYASLVAIGAKRIETRSWRTRYRGPLAIHAAAAFPSQARELCGHEPFRSALLAGGYEQAGSLPVGLVIARCRLLACLPTSAEAGLEHDETPPAGSAEWAFGDYSPGRFMWLLTDVESIEPPRPARGALGLWEWSVQERPLPSPAPAGFDPASV